MSTSTQLIPRDWASTRACGLIALRGEHAAAGAERRVEADALQVARQLLDRVDRARCA